MNINSLETKKEIDSMIDKIYPIGSLYETFDTEFDPNISWGGNWIRDTNGFVTVGAIKPDEYRSVDNTWLEINCGVRKGEVNHTLSIEEIPKHKHSTTVVGEWLAPVTNWAVRAHEAISGQLMDTGYAGGDTAHNNIQPSIGVMRWHRIA